jgi:hypothetical protein
MKLQKFNPDECTNLTYAHAQNVSLNQYQAVFGKYLSFSYVEIELLKNVKIELVAATDTFRESRYDFLSIIIVILLSTLFDLFDF